MQVSAGVFDVWTFRRDSDAIRFLLLYTSQIKADRYFNGGRFWQVPSDFVRDGESIGEAVARCVGLYGLQPDSIWAGEHAYVIYNRRFREMQLIGVYAAEVQDAKVLLRPQEHSDFGWYTMAECLERVHYRGLKDGLRSVNEYVTGVREAAPELCLYVKPT